jgi:adenylate cyclase
MADGPTSVARPDAAPPADTVARGEARARSTVRGVVRLQILANSLGVAAVVAYFRFLFPVRAQTEMASFDLNVVVFGTYLATMILLALPLNAMVLRRAVVWVREGTTPTDRQRKLLFSLPTFETLSALLSWLGAAVLFGVVNSDVQRVSVGIALAGIVTCTLLYLLLEGHFRPLYALALVDADLPEDRRDVMPRLMLAWVLGSGVPLIAIAFSSVIGPEPFDGQRLGWIAGISFVAGGLVMSVAAVSVARPLLRVRDAMRRIEQGDLDTHVPVDDLGELGRLAEGVNNLADGIRERETLRELFNRQVGQAGLADLAMTAGGPVAGERREVTVLFVDLRGYTRFAETHPPEAVVAMLNRFFRIVVAVVNREGGWVNKFEGDAALCLFGAPQDQHDHADRALRTAAALPRELARADDVLGAGIGVASGDVLAGFVGTPERFEYTVIGDVVNLASRLCDEAKTTPGGALASVSTIQAAERADQWFAAGDLSIRGRKGKAKVFALRDAQARRPRRYGIPFASKAERRAP